MISSVCFLGANLLKNATMTTWRSLACTKKRMGIVGSPNVERTGLAVMLTTLMKITKCSSVEVRVSIWQKKQWPNSIRLELNGVWRNPPKILGHNIWHASWMQTRTSTAIYLAKQLVTMSWLLLGNGSLTSRGISKKLSDEWLNDIGFKWCVRGVILEY